tara:strand:+ start:3050 stop:4306 length:1257 start_codon:yes stop_codon:yes gene_type:complete
VISENQKKRLENLSELIYRASLKVKILRHISWPLEVKFQFFKQNCQKLPEYSYPKFDSKDLDEILLDIDNQLGDTKYDLWLKNKLQDIRLSANLLKACGNKTFFDISSKIYGLPSTPIHDGQTKPLDLAEHFYQIINSIDKTKLELSKRMKISSQDVANQISSKVSDYFGELAPKISVVKHLSAKATATSKKIKIRESGIFYQSDIDQLINHEAFIHVATTINGRKQHKMKILGSNYGAVTKTQEGLAVFSEFITGSIDIERMRRISDRVKAIHMAIDGADFIEIYRYFIDKGISRNQAFENSRRVFRGGVLSGKYPFTKDLVYLDGFIRVYNFFRSSISQGKIECIELLFAGKMELDDLPVVYSMYKDGLVSKPSFIPPWAMNLNYLICFFTFSVFLEDINYSNISKYYDYLLKGVK